MTVTDRPVEPGDRLRIPGGSCVATVVFVRVGYDDWPQVTLRADVVAWNRDLERFEAAHGHRCKGTEIEILEAAE